jgi:hypothetical protein
LNETSVKAPHILVIGLGNDLRGDDAVGRVLARRLRPEAGGVFRVLEASLEVQAVGRGVSVSHPEAEPFQAALTRPTDDGFRESLSDAPSPLR